ncbi:hypothetical protein BpHYR1_018193 [Brachionus plicatilis]|uniref:Uncharacterized protein n=1 Tax=Brachionus plicatilis TaxID=10195 RepID=A0A3M7P8F6_BRAPC|nr:hypothetical protein BpHYR1_018193 [Brachionus plicatilis]
MLHEYTRNKLKPSKEIQQIAEIISASTDANIKMEDTGLWIKNAKTVLMLIRNSALDSKIIIFSDEISVLLSHY